MEIVTPIDTACPNDISGSPEIADAFRRAAVHDHQIRNPAGRMLPYWSAAPSVA
jgi:hypothetical protein